MKQKGLAPLVIIILIALGLGGYLLYQKQFKPVSISQPSPSPIAYDETVYTEASRSAYWRTYTSSVFKYKINYPSGWEVEELPTRYFEDQSGKERPVGNTIISEGGEKINITGGFQGGICSGGEKSGCSSRDFETESGIKGRRFTRQYEKDIVYIFPELKNNILISYKGNNVDLGDKIIRSFAAIP